MKIDRLISDIVALSKDYAVKEISHITGVPSQRVRRILKLNVKYVAKYPLDEIVKAHILHVLELHNGNKTHAARDLGISLRCLRYRLNGK